MPNYFNVIFICILLALCSNSLFAQSKYEMEKRIKEEDVPTRALHFIDSLRLVKKVRWYLEKGFGRSSIEAKFKLNKKKYSVEFDTTGSIEDIEVQIKWDNLQPKSKDAITNILKEDCKKFKIRKIQIQYLGSRAVLLEKIRDKHDSMNNIIIRYEIVVRCSETKSVALFEYLFSETGEKLSVSEILIENASNLVY